jgi:hypothetical protein
MDSRGIPGWESVDHLARVLLDLEDPCITNAQTKEIKALYLLPADGVRQETYHFPTETG